MGEAYSPERPISVLFVCRGNTCRSPMAEAWFKALLDNQNQGHRFLVASAGTSACIQDTVCHPNTLSLLHSRGVQHVHTVRGLQNEDFAMFDHILTMDQLNYRDVMDRCPEGYGDKVHLILDPLGGGEILDPYGLGVGAYEQCFEQLIRVLPLWIKRFDHNSAHSRFASSSNPSGKSRLRTERN